MISFDIFDTAISRKVYKPVDIFSIIGDDFKNKRVEAEIKARELKSVYNIDDIYAFLPEYDKQVEIGLELENCYANKYFLDMYDENKHVFISDMYLSSDILKQMLIKCGYTNPKIYVSCEWNAHKGDGSLFKVIPENIELHYGDNYIADILGAKKNNIKSIYCPSLENMPTNIPDIKNKHLKKLLVINEHSNKNLNKKVAYYFAPMIYEFTRWILENRKNEKILFCARDGYLPYVIARDIFKADNIDYIVASRKSILPSSIDFNKPITDEANKTQFERLLIQRVQSNKDFIKSIGYDRSDLTDTKTIRQFILLNQQKLYRYFKRNKENAQKYFSKFNIKNNDIFVDVGYFGTVQYAIERILGIKLNGYYLQTFDTELDVKRSSYFKSNVIKYCLMIESLLTSDEDGVLGYDTSGQPIFYKDNKNKKQFSNEIIKEILDFCNYMHKNNIRTDYNDIEKLTVNFLYYPTVEQSNYCNEPIFENGDINNFESVVWYNREQIKAGYLQDCYNKSYWKPAFEQLLKNDSELCHLEKYLKREY